MKLKQFIQQETVLTVAAVLAVLSMFFVPPDAQYAGYIDFRTLSTLFSLMSVMAGLRRQGVFDRLGRALLARAAITCRKSSVVISAGSLSAQPDAPHNRNVILLDLILFAVCLLSVIRVLPYGVAFAAVLVCTLCADRGTLRAVDYSLLLTFVAFFIFIGNLGRIPAFSGWLQELLTGREVLVAVLASQITSNVPAALLLSGFTAKTESLIIGANLGGLGTLIASMASLISYRQIARELPQEKGRYFGLFTLSNLIFLAILLGVWFILS